MNLDRPIRYAEQILQGRPPIPMLGQGELRGLAAIPHAQTRDHFDGRHRRRWNGLPPLRNMPGDDLVESQLLSELQPQPHVAERAGVGPAHLPQMNTHYLGIVGKRRGSLID